MPEGNVQLAFTKQDGTVATDLNWTPPTTNVDGSPYDATQHGGYTLGVKDANGDINAFVSVPAAYDVTSWPLDKLNVQQPGTLEVALQTVAKNGEVSVWSNTAVFTVRDATVPNAPSGLSVS